MILESIFISSPRLPSCRDVVQLWVSKLWLYCLKTIALRESRYRLLRSIFTIWWCLLATVSAWPRRGRLLFSQEDEVKAYGVLGIVYHVSRFVLVWLFILCSPGNSNPYRVLLGVSEADCHIFNALWRIFLNELLNCSISKDQCRHLVLYSSEKHPKFSGADETEYKWCLNGLRHWDSHGSPHKAEPSPEQ